MSLLTLLFPGGLNPYPTLITASFRASSSTSEVPIGTFPGTIAPIVIGNQYNCNFTTNGTGSDQADRWYCATVGLVAGSLLVLDLTNLKDPDQNTISLARVRALRVRNKSTTDGQNLTIGYSTATSNAWTGLLSNPGTLTVAPCSSINDGCILLAAPNTTGLPVSSTSKLLPFSSGANSFAIDIEILGTSV